MPSLVCSPNAAIAYDFLVGKGLSDFQAAAVIGNLQQESGLNPTIRQPNGPGMGIAQWSVNARWKDLVKFAEQIGRSPWDLDTQLNFLWYELETSPAAGLAQLRASQTLEEAVVIFQDKFEICGDCATNRRIAFAQSALYSCPRARPPIRIFGIAAAATGILAIATAAGFGALKAIRSIRA